MRPEEVRDSYILRVVLQASQLQFSLQDLRTGVITVFRTAQEVIEHVEQRQPSPQKPP